MKHVLNKKKDRSRYFITKKKYRPTLLFYGQVAASPVLVCDKMGMSKKESEGL